MTNTPRTFTLGINYGPRKKAMYWWKDPSQWYRDAGRNFDRLFQERRGAIPDSGCAAESNTFGEVGGTGSGVLSTAGLVACGCTSPVGIPAIRDFANSIRISGAPAESNGHSVNHDARGDW